LPHVSSRWRLPPPPESYTLSLHDALPISIVAVAIIVVSVLMVWVIPIFAKMFTDFGGTLPAPTMLVIGISDFMQKYIIFLIIAADRKSTRLNSSHGSISYAFFCLNTRSAL